MLSREENPELFAILCNRLGITNDKIDIIPSNRLAGITILNIHLEEKISSLKGIEKLFNLRAFILNGANENAPEVEQVGLFNKSLEEEYAIYNKNQIMDLSPLYECKQLEGVVISNQRFIEEVDFANWPNMRAALFNRCGNLKTVKGLSQIKVFSQLGEESVKNSISFDFSGCEKLKNVVDFDALRAAVSWYNIDFKTPILALPIKTYLYMANHSNNHIKNYTDMIFKNKKNDFVGWVDNSYRLERDEINGRQMALLHDRMATILDTICNNQMSPMQQIYSVYNWITHNVTYDRSGLKYAEGKMTTWEEFKLDAIRSMGLKFEAKTMEFGLETAEKLAKGAKVVGKIAKDKINDLDFMQQPKVMKFTQKLSKASDKLSAQVKNSSVVKAAEHKNRREKKRKTGKEKGNYLLYICCIV